MTVQSTLNDVLVSIRKHWNVRVFVEREQHSAEERQEQTRHNLQHQEKPCAVQSNMKYTFNIMLYTENCDHEKRLPTFPCKEFHRNIR